MPETNATPPENAAPESLAPATEHYFSPQPAGEYKTTEIEVSLAGREITVETAGSIFSPERLDMGTDALMRIVPQTPETGNFLDLGCGWGPLAITMALEAPDANIYAIDVNERALALTKRNAARHKLGNIHVSTPQEVAAKVNFDIIWSNPPIRVGKAELHSIMKHWIPRLTVGGIGYFVVAKHLGADSFEKWLRAEFADSYDVFREDHYKGFRVVKVTRLS
jgi:16S rRNA (guanine1207-N2)-methyltransferase